MRDRKGGKSAAPVSVPYIEGGGGLGGALERDTKGGREEEEARGITRGDESVEKGEWGK